MFKPTNLVITSSMANTYNGIMEDATTVFYTSETQCVIPMVNDGHKQTAIITFVKREEETHIDTIDVYDGYTDDVMAMLAEIGSSI